MATRSNPTDRDPYERGQKSVFKQDPRTKKWKRYCPECRKWSKKSYPTKTDAEYDFQKHYDQHEGK